LKLINKSKKFLWLSKRRGIAMKNKNLIVLCLVSFLSLGLTIRNKDTLNNEIKNGIQTYESKKMNEKFHFFLHKEMGFLFSLKSKIALVAFFISCLFFITFCNKVWTKYK